MWVFALAAGVFFTGANILHASMLLRVSSANPRYFVDASGNIVYLNAHSGCPFIYQDGWGITSWPSPDQLAANNENLCRSWVWDNSRWENITFGNHAEANGLITPLPFKRTGPGNALDGQPKFDLNQYDQTFFDGLRTGLIAAASRGIYVIVMLFQGYSNDTRSPWFGHFFNINNNINGVNGDLNDDDDGAEIFTLANPKITAIQDAYVRKMIDSVGDLDNVIWEIANEAPETSVSWQYHMINLITSYEATKGKKHPVLMSVAGSDPSVLFASPADAVAPGTQLFESRTDPYASNPPSTTGNKVTILDTDHIGFTLWNDVDFSLQWIWKSFTRGYNLIYQEMSNNSAAQVGGYTNVYAKKMNLAAMTPRGDLTSTDYALAYPGSEYLIFQPGSGSFTVNISAGTYSYEWFNPTSAQVILTGSIAVSSGNYSFSPPFGGPAVLYLKIAEPLEVWTLAGGSIHKVSWHGSLRELS
jgi:hypothetical protein